MANDGFIKAASICAHRMSLKSVFSHYTHVSNIGAWVITISSKPFFFHFNLVSTIRFKSYRMCYLPR